MDIRARLAAIHAYERNSISWENLARQLSDTSPFEEGTLAAQEYNSHALTMDTFLGVNEVNIDDYKESILEVELLLTQYLPASSFYVSSQNGTVVLETNLLESSLHIDGFAVQEIEVLIYHNNQTAFQYFVNQDGFISTEYAALNTGSLLLFHSDVQSEALEISDNLSCASLIVSDTTIAFFMKGKHDVR